MTSSISQQKLIGTATLSASALIFEIALTRLFSVLYFPPYVFFIISMAILGIGIGAALPALHPGFATKGRLSIYCGGAAISSFFVILLAVSGSAMAIQIPLFALLTLPYLFFGLVISSVFSQYSSASRVLYMSDLLGAGLGALLAIPLMNHFGAVNAALGAILGFAMAGMYFVSGRQKPVALIIVGISAVTFSANVSADFLQVDMSTLTSEKPIVSALANGGKIVQTTWDAFARTDLLDPGDGTPLRIYVDGGAASIMPSQAAATDLMRDIGFFPFATEQPERVFILGPGAGLDVFFALQGKAKETIAVEINPGSVELVASWRDYNDSIYAAPGVEVIIDDGRSALRRTTGDFDLIYLSQVVTLAAERGGYALSENSIYTEDAFAEYLTHLADDGQIALKLYDEITLTRALSTAMAALGRQGLSDQVAIKHLMAFVDERSSPPVPLLLIGASAFDEDDSLVLGAIARDVGFVPLLLPHVLVQPPLEPVDSGAKPFAEIVAASDADVSAPTDIRPYFFQFERGIPSSLIPLATMVAAIALALLALYVRYAWRSQAATTRYLPLYFAMLGAGFIAVEIYAIQQTRLFLGHPTMAVTLVLATLLVGGGIGSGLSQRRFSVGLRRRMYLATALVVLFFLLWNAVWMPLSREFAAEGPEVRATVAVLSLLPLAFFLGIPFPQALELAGRIDRRQVAVAWSVNGAMTVVGSVISVVLSLTLGFNAVLWFGAGTYSLATMIMIVMGRQRT